MFLKLNRFFFWIKNYFYKIYSVFFFKKFPQNSKKMILVIANKHDLRFKKNSFEIRLLNELLENIKLYKNIDHFIFFQKYTFFNFKIFSNKNFILNNLFFFINDNLKFILKFFKIEYSKEHDFWNKLIIKYNPSAIFTISAPNELFKIVEKKKIPLFEFQHGIIDTKIDYFKNLIHFLRKNKDSKYIRFVSWTKESKNYFDNQVKRKISLIYKDPHLSDKITIKKKFQKKVILISLADNLKLFYDIYKINSNLIKFTMPKFLIDYIASDYNYNWIFRFHPTQSYNKEIFYNSWQYKLIKSIFNGQKNVYLDYKFSNTNLKSCLSISDYHIADSSAALITSYQLGIISGCWNNYLAVDRNRVDHFNTNKNSIFSISTKKKIEILFNKRQKKNLKKINKKFNYIKFIKSLNLN